MSERMRVKSWLTKSLKAGLLCCAWIGISEVASAQQYDVLPHRPSVFGQIWLSDGIAGVSGENSSIGNRFRVGARVRFGDEARFAVGWTILDALSSGESAQSVGDISRSGSGPDFSYFFVPDRLWLTYQLDLASATGSRVSGSVGSYGHQLAIGYRFYGENMFGLGTELAYTYIPNVTVPVLDLDTNAGASATYPSAQVWTLSLLISFDLG